MMLEPKKLGRPRYDASGISQGTLNQELFVPNNFASEGKAFPGFSRFIFWTILVMGTMIKFGI